jgi:hypothetical protein
MGAAKKIDSKLEWIKNVMIAAVIGACVYFWQHK